MKNKEFVEIEINGAVYRVAAKDLVKVEGNDVVVRTDSEESKDNYGRVAKTFKRATDLMSKWYQKLKQAKTTRENDKFSRLSEEDMNNKITKIENQIENKKTKKLNSINSNIEDFKKQEEKLKESLQSVGLSKEEEADRKYSEIKMIEAKRRMKELKDNRLEELAAKKEVLKNETDDSKAEIIRGQIALLENPTQEEVSLAEEAATYEKVKSEYDKKENTDEFKEAKANYMKQKEELQNQIKVLNEEATKLRNMSTEDYAKENEKDLSDSLETKQKIKEVVYPEQELSAEEELQAAAITPVVSEELINSEVKAIAAETKEVVKTILENQKDEVNKEAEQEEIKPEENVEEQVVTEEVVEPIVQEDTVVNQQVEEVQPVEETKEETIEPTVQEVQPEVNNIPDYYGTEQGKMLFEQTKKEINRTTENMLNVFGTILRSSNQYYQSIEANQRTLDEKNNKLNESLTEEKSKNNQLQQRMDAQKADYEANYTANTVVESIKTELNSVLQHKEALLQEEQKKRQEAEMKVNMLAQENANEKAKYEHLAAQYKQLSEQIKPIIEVYNRSQASMFDQNIQSEEENTKTR